MSSHNFKYLLIFLSILGVSMEAESKEFWWPYLAAYDDGPGSIRVNLGLQKNPPKTKYPYLVVTGISYETSRKDGLPEGAEIDRLNALNQKILATIERAIPSLYVGTFTHNKEQLHYIYIKENTNIEPLLSKIYSQYCASCKTYTSVKPDQDWSAYNEFLYPNKSTLEFYSKELKELGYVY